MIFSGVLKGMPKKIKKKPVVAPQPKQLEAASFLLESGLLFEINRRVLHPLGLALSVVVEDDGTVKMGQLWDCREDPEGILYDDAGFEEGHQKLLTYLHEHGLKNIRSRYEKLGFIIQGGTDLPKVNSDE